MAEQHIINIINRVLISKRKKTFGHAELKIACRNSYERYLVHKYASLNELSHRSIIDYTRFFTNIKVKLTNNSHCCNDCDGYSIKIAFAPQSFVEINGGCNKQIIGNKDDLPKTINSFFYGFYGWKIREEINSAKYLSL